MNLREWLVVYVKHRDLVKRSLLEVKDAGNHVEFVFKDGVTKGYALERLDMPAGLSGPAILACLHTKENVDTLIKRWKEFATHPELTLILANPTKNEKLIIRPHTHDAVSEGRVEAGLRTMAGEVPYV